jgi:hypothetical protein
MAAPRLPCPRIARGQQHLLPEQETYLHQIFQERLAAVRTCAPINEQEAEGYLSQAYRVLGLAAPRIRWFDSPLAFLAAYTPQWVSHSSGTELGENVHGQIQALVEHVLLGIWESTSEPIWDQVEGSMPESSTWDSVGNALWLQVYNEIRAYNEKRFWRPKSPHAYWRVHQFGEDEAWESVYWDREKLAALKRLPWPQRMAQDQTWRKLQETIESKRLWAAGRLDLVSAYRDVGRLACFRFFHEVCEDNELIHLARLNELVSGYHLGDAQAWLIRKPVRLGCDEQGRLHSEDGIAIQYADGMGIYAWHGVPCPERYIWGNLTRADWLGERNLERRRVIEERLGPERLMALLGGRRIDQSRRGKLIEIDLPDDPERVAHYLQVRDPSTNRQYYLRVPPSITNADEAVAWTFGLDAAAYQPDQEA